MPHPSLTTVLERGFAAGVCDRLAEGPFTFTDRTVLLVKARQLGIDPVKANLIIGEQQLRRSPRRSGSHTFATVAGVIAVQGIILAAVTWACLA